MKKGTKILIGGLVLVGVISAVGGNGEDKAKTGNNSKTEVKEEVAYTTIDMNTLMNDLESNPASAKNKYEDQYFEVTGYVNVIDADGKYFSVRDDNEYSIKSLHVSVDKEDKDFINNLQIGQQITIKVKITDVGEILAYSGKLIIE